jgi:putative mRNA 3-end processing factor
VVFSVTAHGAAEEVGRSAFVLDFGEKFLLDYGIKLNPETVDYPIEINEHVKAVILSHAHLDHSGLLPYFYKKSECLSFMTQPTLDISDVLWKDSIKIAEFEGMAPKYNKAEIERTHRYNFVTPYNKELHLTKEVSLEFFDAGHILGSALTKLTYGEKSFLYTGDYKLEETRLHKGCDMSFGKVDYVMIESTYGDRPHPNRKEVEKRFCESVQETINGGGWAIVPVLAVGRSQEIIDVLSNYHINADIYLDGMGKQMAEIYIKHSDLIKDPKQLKRALNDAIWVKGQNGRKKVMKKPCIIVTTSGMMKGGPVIGYLEKLINDPRSKIHLTSYQADGTPGRMLMDTGKVPFGKDGAIIKPICKYEKFDFSAHPSQDEMIKSLKAWSPSKIFLVHGDKKVMPIFKKKIESTLGIDTTILPKGKKIDFD